MTRTTGSQVSTLAVAALAALAGCRASSDSAQDTAVAAPGATPSPGASGASGPALPQGWTDLALVVGARPCRVHTPPGHRVEEADWGTAVYADIEDYPFYYSITAHAAAPEPRELNARDDWQRRDGASGYTAERREQDGTGWGYIVYSSSLGLACHVGLYSTSGVSESLMRASRAVCDSMR